MKIKEKTWQTNDTEEDWHVAIPGATHKREIEKPKPDGKEDYVLVFAGDPTWMWDLNKKFSIAEWILSFIDEFPEYLPDEILNDILSDFTGAGGELHTLDGILGSLPHAILDDHEYWEGPGPVSGYNSLITMHKNNVESSVQLL